jgi:hypothetical protein
MFSTPGRSTLTSRHRAILRAVEAGRGEALCGCAPDLLIDGRFCDYIATRELFRAGLIDTDPGPPGRRAAARVTDEGRRILAVAAG